MKHVKQNGKLAFVLLASALVLGLALPASAGVSVKALVSAFLPELRGHESAETDMDRNRQRWSLGDTVVREIDGERLRFRCIDENYSDEMEYHRQGALFLCDTVVPANYGSRYEFETPGDKEHGYEFYPGPIVNFGDSCEYKYSAIRSWLQAAESGMDGAEPINTGVFRAYTGSTPEAMYSSFDGGTMHGSYIGSQKMTDRLFILSVDEAFRYRDWLWRFDGAAEENPESQLGPFAKGYWLRTSAGPWDTGEDSGTGAVYIVDLVNGNIHPTSITPAKAGGEQDAELNVTGTTGVRPAFVLPQS